MRKVLFAALLCFSVVAGAGEIKGAGATTCGAWLRDRQHNDHFSQLNWVLGYISSYNMFVYNGKDPNGIFGSVDPEAIQAWLDNYCREYPLDPVARGATTLVNELKSRVQR